MKSTDSQVCFPIDDPRLKARIIDEATRLRERLAAAGLLADPPEAAAAVAAAEAPSAGRLAAARSRAGSGTALADLVHGGR